MFLRTIRSAASRVVPPMRQQPMRTLSVVGSRLFAFLLKSLPPENTFTLEVKPLRGKVYEVPEEDLKTALDKQFEKNLLVALKENTSPKK